MKLSGISDTVLSKRNVKYLLLIPIMVVVVFGSYQIGRYAAGSPKTSHGKETELLRKRRDAILISPPVNQSYTIIKAGGAVYTRWGRTECPSDSDAVYSGVAGGSFYDVHGGGSNYLCLPMDPIWDYRNETVEKGSKVYGAEYSLPQGFNLENNGGRSLHDHNVPCAVCRSQTKTSVVMIPARNLCYDGWKTEYSGYLVSGNSAHKGRSEFVCMDRSPESDPAGYRDENGALFTPAEGVCGSLPCPPYIPRKQLTCVVCSK